MPDGSWDIVHTSTCWLIFGSPAETLKNRSRSPEPFQLFIKFQCYNHANPVEICQPVHEIWCTQALFGLNLAVLSPAVTLKIRSRSPKPSQLFIMSQCYIHANLVKIHPLVHEISCKQESVTPTQKQMPTVVVCLGFTSLSTIFQLYHNSVWLRQGAQCSLL